MANVQTQSMTQMLQSFASTVQGAVTSAVLNFNVGTVLRAIGEAVASIALWLQGQILLLLAYARGSTSTGSDLDSWFADFGFSRIAATVSSGIVTFSRFTPTAQAVIPVGAVVQTTDGSQQFTVILDTTNSAYSAALSGYVIAAGTTSVSVTVQAVAAGSAGNVLANTITQLSQSVTGVDTVTNAAAFTNGQDAELDAAALTRFRAWLQSLWRATTGSITNAVTSLNASYTCTITQNASYAGAYQPGYFYVVVDDGTGSPPSSVISAVYAAVAAVAGATISFDVFAPVKVSATVTMSITAASGYIKANVAAAVQTALQTYINSIGIGATLNYTKLAQIAYEASPGVANVSAVLLNGATADLTATSQQIIKYSSVVVS
jgi:uncharacterized phage protein gp47/JayE